MQLAKSITSKIINALCTFHIALLVLFSAGFLSVQAQDNSPYSRYGLGDMVPGTHIVGRSMGGISAAYTDAFGTSINFNNPASYSSFQTIRELKSKKLVSGRAILDLGLNFESRTLKEPNAPKFTASNALFSYMQVGVPLKPNWGLSFGIRPITRISYKIDRKEKLFDPNTGLPIDTALTNFTGDGGSYLASIGTGFSLFHKLTKNGEEKLSVGFNAGYLFGKKDYSVRRSILNDTLDYYQANYESKTTFGNLYFNAGILYKVPLNKNTTLSVGAYGNWGQNLKASEDILRETYVFDDNSGNVRLDSVSDRTDIKGKIMYPSSYTFGFVLERYNTLKEPGWLIGIDFAQQSWDKYRFYGLTDSVQNNWQVRIGGQLRPVSKRTYLSNVAYRAGFYFGPDYIKVVNKLPQYGITLGLGLPVANYRSNYSSAGQATLINLGFEYGKRGNSDNLLRESTFRFSVGFSLSDFWFIKRKYD